MTADPNTHRNTLQHLFDCALESVAGDKAVARVLATDDIGERVSVVAMGKAASSMVQGAQAVLQDRLTKGLVLTKNDHVDQVLADDPRLLIHESAHPVPDESSLRSGDVLVEFVQQVPPDDDLLVLVSGGLSSLVEQLPPGMTLTDLSRVTEFLLAGGFDITQINQVRRSISRIKGGRLAVHLRAQRVYQYAISDVPGDSLQDIGSGPLALPQTDRHALQLPDWIVDFQQAVALPDECALEKLASIKNRVVASSDIARSAVCDAATSVDLPVQPVTGDLHQDVAANTAMIAEQLLKPDALPGIYVWAGGSTLQLPEKPGRGGRNQHLALLLAREIDGHPVTVLCGATDGTDGPTSDAGGIVDGRSAQLVRDRQLDIQQVINAADSGNLLEQTGELLTTGPTGTNVMDLVIAIR